MNDYDETYLFDDITNMRHDSPDVYQNYISGHQSQIKSHNEIPVVVIIHVRRKHSTASEVKGDHNYLRHFRKIYASQGWITVQCSPSEDRVLNGESDQIVSSLLYCLERQGLSTNPLVLHLLGHHAIPIHNALTRATANEREDLFLIKGCIVDSGPLRSSGCLAYIRRHHQTTYFFVMLFLWLLASIFPELIQQPADFDEYDSFCFNTGGWPQLYLYSSTDHVVHADDVEHVMSVRHRAGVSVDAKCWHDTEHARHLFTHEEEYTRLCQDFVSRIIAL